MTLLAGLGLTICTKKDAFCSHLKVLWCKPFAHVPNELQSEFNDKVLPYIFVGYGGEEFGYRLRDLQKETLLEVGMKFFMRITFLKMSRRLMSQRK